MRDFENLPDRIKQQFISKASEFITPDMFFCTRVWEAWDVGTMTKDDFQSMEEDEDFIVDLAKFLFDTSREIKSICENPPTNE